MDKQNADPMLSKIFFNKYKLEKKLGEGSFGRIYSCVNIKTNEKFAIKIENKNDNDNLLESEACVLSYLKGPGIPIVKSYGSSGNSNLLVMELLGLSLEDLFTQLNNKFTLKTVCMLAIQIIDRIEYVHSKHIVHRDIKPDNFVMGLEANASNVYVIDFGLSKKYRSSKTLLHYEIKNNKKLTGTARYASINALLGVEQSRRDDLEAIGYVLLYFLRGSLPWQGLKINKNEDRYKKIYEKKLKTSAEELCKGFPQEFVEYINYTRNMQYEQDPDYEYLRNLFNKIMKENLYENDFIFDWTKKIGSPKTHSTMVPPMNENLAKEEFKLNVSGADKNKPITPSNANFNLVNSTVNVNFTSKAVNTLHANRDENSQGGGRRKTLNNQDNNVQSTVFRINHAQQNSIEEIEESKKVIKEYEETREKKRKNTSGGCCFA